MNQNVEINPATPFIHQVFCECGGELVFTQQQKPDLEPGKFLFIHQCAECKKLAAIKQIFPFIEWRPVYREINKKTDFKILRGKENEKHD